MKTKAQKWLILLVLPVFFLACGGESLRDGKKDDDKIGTVTGDYTDTSKSSPYDDSFGSKQKSVTLADPGDSCYEPGMETCSLDRSAALRCDKAHGGGYAWTVQAYENCEESEICIVSQNSSRNSSRCHYKSSLCAKEGETQTKKDVRRVSIEYEGEDYHLSDEEIEKRCCEKFGESFTFFEYCEEDFKRSFTCQWDEYYDILSWKEEKKGPYEDEKICRSISPTCATDSECSYYYICDPQTLTCRMPGELTDDDDDYTDDDDYDAGDDDDDDYTDDDDYDAGDDDINSGDCQTNYDCAGTPSTPYCQPGLYLCVECLTDSHCAQKANTRCHPSEGRCIECIYDTDCDNGYICDAQWGGNGICLECVSDNDCLPGYVCSNYLCITGCASDEECCDVQGAGICLSAETACSDVPLNTPRCDIFDQCTSSSRMPLQVWDGNQISCFCAVTCSLEEEKRCSSSADCADPSAPICDTNSKTCVQCLGNFDCAPGYVCDTETKTCFIQGTGSTGMCGPCVSDRDCGTDTQTGLPLLCVDGPVGKICGTGDPFTDMLSCSL